jgi:hypothetical protein
MILATTTKLMKTGIFHYSKEEGIPPQNTQIHIRLVSDKIDYKIAYNWKPTLEVTFKQIMQKPIDIFQYESLAGPYFKKSLIGFAAEKQIPLENVSAFIHLSSKEELIISFYNKGTFVQQLKLSEQLEKLGFQI